MKKLFTSFVILSIVAFQCSAQAPAGRVVLTGEIEGECEVIQVLEYLRGEDISYGNPIRVENSFRLEVDGVDNFVDLGVAFDDEVVGAHIVAGDSLHMKVKIKGKVGMKYEGRHERESRMWTDFYNTYEYIGQYNLRPDPDSTVTRQQMFDLLSANDARFRKKHGKHLDAYYDHLAKLRCNFIKLVLLEYEHDKNGTDCFCNPEYVNLINDIDPDDPDAESNGLLSRWALFNVEGVGNEGDVIKKAIDFMSSEKGRIKSSRARSYIATLFSRRIFNGEVGPDEYDRCNDYIETVAAYVPENPTLVEGFRKDLEAVKALGSLADMPDVVLHSPDGKAVSLSSLFGKVLYIDFWATWCGPCVAQIPHLERLVKEYEGNEDVAFISISLDSKETEWLRKLDTDKPFWPQYRIEDKEGKEFFDKLRLTTIPRFIIVGRDGCISDIDAKQPSDSQVKEQIDNAIMKY